MFVFAEASNVANVDGSIEAARAMMDRGVKTNILSKNPMMKNLC